MRGSLFTYILHEPRDNKLRVLLNLNFSFVFLVGKLVGPEADRLGRPLRKERKKLNLEKYELLGVPPKPEVMEEDDD